MTGETCRSRRGSTRAGVRPAARSPSPASALVADCAGALYWPEEGLLVVADLHLEKGSSFAARGVLLPPYDTAATLGAARRSSIARYAPRARDRARRQLPRRRRAGAARRRRPRGARARCSAAATGSGSPATTIPIRPPASAAASPATLALGALTFRHEPTGGAARRDRRPSASGRARERGAGAR